MPTRSRANECRVKLLDPDAVTDNVMAGLWLSVTGKPVGLASSIDSRFYGRPMGAMAIGYRRLLASVSL